MSKHPSTCQCQECTLPCSDCGKYVELLYRKGYCEDCLEARKDALGYAETLAGVDHWLKVQQ